MTSTGTKDTTMVPKSVIQYLFEKEASPLVICSEPTSVIGWLKHSTVVQPP